MICIIDVYLVLEFEMFLLIFINFVNKSLENVRLEIVEICYLNKIVGLKFFILIILVDRGRNLVFYFLFYLEDIFKDYFLKIEEWEVSDIFFFLDFLF